MEVKKPAKCNADEINPFTFEPPFTTCDKIMFTKKAKQIFINLFWLLPLRLFLLVIPSVTAGAVLLFLCGLGNKYDPDNPTPLPKWRKVMADKVGSLIARIFLLGFGYHWIHQKGSPAHPTLAPIMAAVPHSSMIDIFVVMTYGLPSFVSRESVRNYFIFGPIITKTMRTIFVKRDDKKSRARAGAEIRRRAECKGRWPRILVFPEGTTHNRKMILLFKKGAFQPGLPIQPCLIKYQNRLGTATWCGPAINQLKGLAYTMCQFHNHLTVEFLDVYVPSEKERGDAEVFSRNMQLLVAQKLGVVAGMHTLEDNFIMAQAHRLGLPLETGMVVYGKVQSELGLGGGEVKNSLTRFARMNRQKDGKLTWNEAAEFLGVASQDCELKLYFDDMTGFHLNFREYLYTIFYPSLLILKDEDFLKAAFDRLDSNNNGQVSSRDFSDVLSVKRLVKEDICCSDGHFDSSSFESQTRKRYGKSKRECYKMQDPASGNSGWDRTFTYDEFKMYLKSNPEYLLLLEAKFKSKSVKHSHLQCLY